MSRLQSLPAAVRKLHEASPELKGFAPWPDDLSGQQTIPRSCPAALGLGLQRLPGTRATAPVILALRAAAPDLEWRHTYSEAEVGAGLDGLPRMVVS